MNDERMPINIYKLDAGYNDKGMNMRLKIINGIYINGIL